MSTTALFKHPFTTVTSIGRAKAPNRTAAKAAQVRALYAEAQALVAGHRKLADDLHASLQSPDLTPEGRLSLEQRYQSKLEELRREMAQLAVVRDMVDTLDTGTLGPAERRHYAAALSAVE
jgi:hypothetical protein